MEEVVVVEKSQLSKCKLMRFLMPANHEKTDSSSLGESSRARNNSRKDTSIPNEEMKSIEIILPSRPNSSNALKWLI
jgi:hypothetical protein